MSIIRSITLSQIKKAPRRFIVTVIGVIISTAMLTAVCASYSSAIELLKQVAIRNGEYHYLARVPYTDKAEQFANDEKFSSYCFTQEGATVDLGLDLSVGVAIFNGDYEKHAAVKLVEGTLPKSEGEAAINERTAQEGLKIGDTLSIKLENKLITAKVTGIIKDTANRFLSGYYNVMVYSKPHLNDNVTLTVGFKDINKDTTAYARRLAETLWQGEQIYSTPNDGLLRYYNAQDYKATGVTLGDAVKGVAAVAIIIVIAASVLMIYNSFSISTAQRRKMLGMLASVGATPTQKCAFTFWEALFVGGIGIPIGLLSGYVGIAVTLSLLGDSINKIFSSGAALNVHTDAQTFILSAALAAVTVIISAFLPSVSAAKISPIEAVRGVKAVKYKAKKPSVIMKRLFGFEGALAAVNMKRSGKRYAATLLSLSFAVILVIAAFGPISLIERAFALNNGDGSYNVFASLYGLNSDNYINMTDTLSAKAKDGDKVYTRFTLVGVANAAYEEIFSDKTLAIITQPSDKLYVRVTVLENDEYEELTGKATGEGIGCIVQNRLTTQVNGVNTELKTHTRLNKNDYVLCNFNNSLVSFNVDKVIDHALSAMTSSYYSPQELALFISESTFKQIIASGMEIDMQIFYKTENPEELYDIIRNDEIFTSGAYANSVGYDEGEVEAILLLIKVFTGGFVCLIALVAAANITNTVYTGVLLRRRELAMIKSVGLEQGRIKKMVFLESIIYSLKALLYGLPIGVIIYLLEQRMIVSSVGLSFYVPIGAILTAALGVILVTVISALPAVAALKDTPIAQLLRQDAE